MVMLEKIKEIKKNLMSRHRNIHHVKSTSQQTKRNVHHHNVLLSTC